MRLLSSSKSAFIFILFFSAFLSACSDSNNTPGECGFIVDSVEIIDRKQAGNIIFYLAYRVTGFQDKTEILELYDKKPIFDHCSKSATEPVYGNSLDMSMTVSHLYLDVKNKSLDIIYTKGIPSIDHNKNLKIELKKTTKL